MSKRKIAHLTFDMRFGGTEQVISNLVQNTNLEKYDVSILCLSEPIGPFGLQLIKQGIKIHAFNRQPGFDTTLIRDIRKYICENRIDILHCHQYTPYVYGVFAALRTPVKVLYTEHGRFYPDQQKLKRVFINPLLNFFTDKITSISAATRKALVNYENFPENQIQVVYNGIDDSRFIRPANGTLRESLNIPPHAAILGTVARLDSIKNHPMMIKALKIVQSKFPETVLIIVGDGPERQRLDDLINELDLSEKVIITGFRKDTEAFYQIMDIFLLTSFSEGTAMTLLEAMATSRPCIVTQVGGNPEIVLENQTGFVIPSDDDEALAQKIIHLIENRELKIRFGANGRKRFERCFTVNQMVNAYQAIYETL